MIFRAQNTIDTVIINSQIRKFQPLIKREKEELGIQNCKIALYIGGIEKRKKINHLIKAINAINKKGISCKALIVGDGSDKEWYVEQLNDEERSVTLFVGKQIEESVLYILLSDVVTLPAEGGLSIPQSFACGKPFIASSEVENGGVVDYIKHGENGFLFEEDNINQLIGYLELVFADDKLYSLLCNNALKSSELLSLKKMVDGIEKAIWFTLKK